MLFEVKIPKTRNELINSIRNSNIEKFEILDDIKKTEFNSLIRKIDSLMTNGRTVSVIVMRSKK